MTKLAWQKITSNKNKDELNKYIKMMQKKIRLSNIELLRFLAMVMVLVVHANFYSVSVPQQTDMTANPLNGTTRFFFESLSIVCVDVFVLISGWFGIRPSKKGVANLLFQCFFFLFGIYAGMLLGGWISLNLKDIGNICLASNKVMWFIKSYILLYILAPVLNAFVEKTDKRAFGIILIAFFTFQSIYGWLTPGAQFFEDGFSTISFIGLYLLARYVKIYQPKWSILPPPF